MNQIFLLGCFFPVGEARFDPLECFTKSFSQQAHLCLGEIASQAHGQVEGIVPLEQHAIFLINMKVDRQFWLGASFHQAGEFDEEV